MRMTVVWGAALILLSTVLAADPPPPASYVYKGTILEVRSEGSSVVVVTGVGMALRSVAMKTTPATRIAEGVRSLAPKDLARGKVVRAECRMQDGMLVVDRLDVVTAP